jgi:hypothetical protein
VQQEIGLMSDSVFADGISDIVIAGGVVRIEFFVLTPDRDASAKAGEPAMQRIRTATVAMPLTGFAGSLKMLDDLRQKLVADGILRPAGDAPTPEPQRKSPNFG